MVFISRQEITADMRLRAPEGGNIIAVTYHRLQKDGSGFVDKRCVARSPSPASAFAVPLLCVQALRASPEHHTLCRSLSAAGREGIRSLG